FAFRSPNNFNEQPSSEEQPMVTHRFLFVAAAIAAVFVTQSSAQALTMSECSAKYKSSKAAGTLNGASWNDFRKSQCDLAPTKPTKIAAASDSTIVASNAVFECGRFKICERESGSRPAQDLPRSVQGQ